MDQLNNTEASGLNGLPVTDKALLVPASLQEELHQISQGTTACEAALQATVQAAMGAHRETSLALNRRLAAVFDTLAAGQTDKLTLEQLLQSGRDIQIDRDAEHGCYTAVLRVLPTASATDGQTQPVH